MDFPEIPAVDLALQRARARGDVAEAEAQAGTLAVLRAAATGATPEQMRAASRAAREREAVRKV